MARLLPLLVLLAATSAAAQDPILTVASELNLSEAQVDIVRANYRPESPGMAWTLTAALKPTLTSAQRLQLLATPRSERRTGLEPEASRGRSDFSPADQAAAKAVRNAVLGLSARESAELDRALLDSRDDRNDRALTPGVSRLLDDEQEEIVRMQRGIVRLLFRAELSGARGGEARREAARRRNEATTRDGAREAARRRQEATREGAREAARARQEAETRAGARDAARIRREAAARDAAQARREAAQARREAAAREAAREAARRRNDSTRGGSQD